MTLLIAAPRPFIINPNLKRKLQEAGFQKLLFLSLVGCQVIAERFITIILHLAIMLHRRQS